ncbi:tyrosine-protein phosphatase [Thermodesulfobacteriota bacterium]
MTECERFLAIGGSLNFRHMGGYPEANGRRTRSDRLFRSGHFSLESQTDIDFFEDLEISLIFDFRSASESKRRPLVLAGNSSPEIMEMDISSGNMGPFIRRLVVEKKVEGDCRSEMRRMYYSMYDEAQTSFKKMFEGLLGCDGAAMVLCSLGKDRTGVASALVLAALGVSRDEIFEDYMLSAKAYRGLEIDLAMNSGLRLSLADAEFLKDAFTVYPDYLQTFWQRAEDTAGSIDEFLRKRLGFNGASVEKLRDKFTE